MTYTIKVTRKNGNGTLTFKSGSVNISETCWWDKDVVIDAGSYVGYATRMANKEDGTDGGKREGIWLGKNVPYNGDGSTANGFFHSQGDRAILVGWMYRIVGVQGLPDVVRNLAEGIRQHHCDHKRRNRRAGTPVGLQMQHAFHVGRYARVQLMASKQIAAVVAVCLSASLAGAQDGPAQSPNPADAVEMLELLIGQDPSRHATPLAAMHGRATLYTDYRERAGSDDETALRIWLLLADFSVRSADASAYAILCCRSRPDIPTRPGCGSFSARSGTVACSIDLSVACGTFWV